MKKGIKKIIVVCVSVLSRKLHWQLSQRWQQSLCSLWASHPNVARCDSHSSPDMWSVKRQTSWGWSMDEWRRHSKYSSQRCLQCYKLSVQWHKGMENDWIQIWGENIQSLGTSTHGRGFFTYKCAVRWLVEVSQGRWSSLVFCHCKCWWLPLLAKK